MVEKNGRAQFSILSKRFFLFLGLGVGVFLSLSLYGNWKAVSEAFKHFSYITLPLILALAFMNYLSRFWRWELYLKRVEISLTRKESFYIFMSGLVMTVTPGKMGELLKSYLLEQNHRVPLARSGPIVLAERFTDLLARLFPDPVGKFLLCLRGQDFRGGVGGPLDGSASLCVT